MMQKKVLITGVSKGIGLEIAKVLLENEFFVYGIGRSSLAFSHPSFTYFQKDIRKQETIDFLLQNIQELDVLINNAGVGVFRMMEDLKREEIIDMVETNLLSPMLLARAFYGHLKKSRGNIINMGSESALKGEKLGTAYCASKFGLRGFTESLWNEARKHHVKVTLINAGVIDSTFFDDKDFAPEKTEHTALQPKDIAKVVFDVLSMREGSVIREIEVLPQKHSLIKKRKESENAVKAM